MLTVKKVPGEPFFVSIVAEYNRTPEETAAEIEEQHRLSGLVNFAVSFPLQPQGTEPLKKAVYYASFFRRLQAARTNADLKIGILVQQTIGHGNLWNLNFNRELNWQRIERNDGEATIRFCPLDPCFQEYISTAIRLVTEEKPDFLIIDDDCRLSFMPGKHLVECFCPLHTAFFNRKYGTCYTPEELRKAITQAKENDPLQLQFVRSGMETIKEYVHLLRKAADDVLPGIPMILCGCGPDAGRSGIWASELAAKDQPPILRVGNGSYLENAPREIVFRQADTARQKLYCSDASLLLDEADTCPHSRYSKSVRTMHLHIVSGLLNGLDGAKLWITNMVHPDSGFSGQYAASLKKHLGMYRELHRIMKQFVRLGPVVDLPPPEHAPFPAFPAITAPFGDWAQSYLSLFGLPYRWGKPGESGVHLITESTADWFTDAELERILADPALIDAGAAIRLILRGYGEKIGLSAVEELTLNSSLEIMSDGTVLRKSRGPYFHLKPRPGTEILTMLKSNPRFSAPDLTDVAPGAIQCGKIIVTAWKVQPNNRIDMNTDRRDLLLKLLSRLDAVPARLVSDGDAGFWYGHIDDGRLMAAVNYSFDPMEECLFEISEPPKEIRHLDSDGSWKKVLFTIRGNRIMIPVRLECAEVAIFMIRNH